MMKQHAVVTIATGFGVFAALFVLAVAVPIPTSVSFGTSPIGNGVMERRVTRDLQFLAPAEWGFGTDAGPGVATGTFERQPDGTVRSFPMTVVGYRRRWGVVALDVGETYIRRDSP